MSRTDFLATLQQKIALFDGGMGSMLIAAGLSSGETPEAWVLNRPEEIAWVHQAYLQAGAEVLTTATFGASRLKLASSTCGRSLDVVAVNERAVEIARKAMEDDGVSTRFLAGDIGPSGQFFPPLGALRASDARASFREQAQVLCNAGVDLFLIETMYDLREALEALRAVRELSDLPVLVCLTFDQKPRGFFTIMGDTPGKAVDALLPEGASGLGANCTLGSRAMIELAGTFRPLTVAPLLFQPNAGQPVMEGEIPQYRQQALEFAQDMMAILQTGANAIGGCCGTTPDFIRETRKLLLANSNPEGAR